MKPKFKIKRIGAQNASPCYDTFLTANILNDISKRLLNTIDYDVEWIEERNKGRLIILETSNEIHYIDL